MAPRGMGLFKLIEGRTDVDLVVTLPGLTHCAASQALLVKICGSFQVPEHFGCDLFAVPM